MPFTVQLGLLLAFVTALMSVLGFLLKHRGAVAAPPVDSAHADYGGWEMLGYVGLATIAGLGLVAMRSTSGLALAVAAGLLWAGSDVTIKALSGRTGALGAGVLLHPFAFVILVLSLVGLLVSARSLQIGEPLPEEPFALAVRLAAFALAIGAAAMTPPPLRIPATA